jgi:hypothetical protein
MDMHFMRAQRRMAHLHCNYRSGGLAAGCAEVTFLTAPGGGNVAASAHVQFGNHP